MFFQMRNSAGLVVLVLLAWVAFLIGKTFTTAMTIFAIFVWVIVGVMFTYMVMFRGVRFTFSQKPPSPEMVEPSEVGETFEDDVDRSGTVVALRGNDGDN